MRDSEFFTQRGKVETSYEANGKTYPITLRIPTNHEHDTLMEKYTTLEKDKMSIDGAGLMRESLMVNIISPPFDCDGTPWEEATDKQKFETLDALDAAHRDPINLLIVGESSLPEKKADFLDKP